MTDSTTNRTETGVIPADEVAAALSHLLSTAARLARGEAFHGDDADKVSDNTHANFQRMATRIMEDREALRVENERLRNELAEKWELWQACSGAEVYSEVTPRIDKLYMQLNASARGDETDFDGDPVKPWNNLVELTVTAVLRWIVANRWAVNEHQRVEQAEAQLDVAYDVIRRLRDGWHAVSTTVVDGTKHEWWRAAWDADDEKKSMTDAERAVLDAVAGPNDPPEAEPAEPERTVMAMVAGRSFACEACSANVFVEITEPGDVKPRYRCNGCGAEYVGTWPPAASPNDTEENRHGE